MKITLKQVSKRYNYEWIFRNLDFTFHSGKSYALLGPNGSGKSSLLQVIAGNIVPSEGEIFYSEENLLVKTPNKGDGVEKNIEPENFFRHISIATPYLELPEEMNFEEVLQFHSGFKKFRENFSIQNIIEQSGLKKSAKRQIRHYSSGMKQRAKLTLAILSDAPVLLLDEPTTNLDEAAVVWWKNLLDKNASDRIIIIASNIEREFISCDERVLMSEWK